MERESFLFYRSYLDAIDKIKDTKTKYKLLMGIIGYGLDRTEPEFNDELSQMAWVFIKPLLDANYRNYMNGCKGGAPKGTVNNPAGKNQYSDGQRLTDGKPKDNRRKTTGKGNENVKDNVNDNDKDKVNDNANDNDNENVNINKEICPFVDENGIITDWEKFQEWKRKHPDWKGADD